MTKLTSREILSVENAIRQHIEKLEGYINSTNFLIFKSDKELYANEVGYLKSALKKLSDIWAKTAIDEFENKT